MFDPVDRQTDEKCPRNVSALSMGSSEDYAALVLLLVVFLLGFFCGAVGFLYGAGVLSLLMKRW